MSGLSVCPTNAKVYLCPLHYHKLFNRLRVKVVRPHCESVIALFNLVL